MNGLRFGSVGHGMVARTGRCLTIARDRQHCGMSASKGALAMGFNLKLLTGAELTKFGAKNLATQPSCAYLPAIGQSTRWAATSPL
jgi:hypothetical protein